MTGRTVCLIRTHRFGAAERRLLAFLRPRFGADLFMAADESRGPVDTEGVPKIALDDAALRELGLRPVPHWGWRCGDYFLTAARAALPGADRFWLIERDVWTTHPDADSLFARFDGADADLMAARYTPKGPYWHWTHLLAPHVDGTVHGMFFPILRATPRVIDAAHDLRRRLDAAIAERSQQAWPNDESVMATAAHLAGARVTALGRFLPEDPGLPALDTPENRFHHIDDLPATPPRLYHPVYEEADYQARLEHQARTRPRRVDALIARHAHRVPPERAEALRGIADAALQARGTGSKPRPGG